MMIEIIISFPVTYEVFLSTILSFSMNEAKIVVGFQKETLKVHLTKNSNLKINHKKTYLMDH